MSAGGGGTASSAAAASEAACSRDEPEDLSTTSRRSNGDRSPSAGGGGLLAGSGRPTDHSIATIMKYSPTGVGGGTGFADADGYDGGGADGMRVVRKKQRVEDIVHSIYPRLPGHGLAGGLAEAGEWRRRKNTRKQVQPQQHGSMASSDAGACSLGSKGTDSGSVRGEPCDRTGPVHSGDNGEVIDGFDNDDDADSGSQAATGALVDEDEEKVLLRRQLSAAITQLNELRSRFRTLAAPPQRSNLDVNESRSGCNFIAEPQAAATASTPSGTVRLPPEWQQLLAAMRDEIRLAVSNAVSGAVEKFAAAAAAAGALPSSSAVAGSTSLLNAAAIGASVASTASLRMSPLNLKAAGSFTSAQRPSYLDINFNNRRGSTSTDAAALSTADELLLLPPGDTGLQHSSQLQKSQRKRTKVTDTRLSPRAARVLMAEIRPIEEDRQPPLAGYPEEHFLRRGDSQSSSVATSAYRGHALKKEICSGLSFSSAASNEEDDFEGEGGGDASRLQPYHGAGLRVADESSDDACAGGGDDDTRGGGGCSDVHSRLTSTLTPLHLRKAKLMFFYVRYPSSALLKAFFPDVRFNKNNTAQLVKWFSNFREFYYIQMEKYARQMFADGQSSDDVSVTVDSELYKVLNLHYNRSNQIEVPRSFRTVVQATLKEFVRAISTSRDQEQSWKKPIYKVIMRMDDSVPDFFKSLRWMEQLTD